MSNIFKLKSQTAVFVLACVTIAIASPFYLIFSHKLIQFTYSPSQDTRQITSNFGTDFSRIDSQITLKIPEGKAQKVYDYLRKTYVDNDKTVKKAFPNFNIKGEPQVDISDFTDDYFDTSYLDLYQSQNTIRFRHRENTVNPADPKSGKELIQIKITPAGRFDLRSELKFKVNNSNPNSSFFLDRIDPALRADFQKAIFPLTSRDLRPILTLNQKRSRVYLDLDKINFLSFSVDKGQSTIWGKTGQLSSIDIGLVETAYTEADETLRKKFQDINAFVVDDLQKKFPELIKTSEDKYVVILSQIIRQIPLFRVWRLLGLI